MSSPADPRRILALDIARTFVRFVVTDRDGSGVPVVGIGEARRPRLLAWGRVIDPAMLESAIRDVIAKAAVDPADTPAWVGMPTHAPTAVEAMIQRTAAVIVRCCHGAGLRIEGTVPAAAASAIAVTTVEERERGVVVVDLGGGPIKFAVYLDGALARLGASRRQGEDVVLEVVRGTRALATDARQIVAQHGCALPRLVESGELLSVPHWAGRPARTMERWVVAELIHDALLEILHDVRCRLAPADLRGRVPAGIVVTGALARLPGIAEFAHEMLDLPVRVGAPRLPGCDNVGPEHATVVGLALHAGYGADACRADAQRSGVTTVSA